jgi:hypothetical protein
MAKFGEKEQKVLMVATFLVILKAIIDHKKGK